MPRERSDGSAAAGVLGRVFAFEPTAALITCAACGTTDRVAAAHLYDGGPGLVLRCPGCETVLVCIAETPAALLVGFREVASVRVAEPPTDSRTEPGP